MMTQPGAYAGVAQTHGPTVAGAMQDVEMDEMPEAALECVRREGEPSQGFMNEGAWEEQVCRGTLPDRKQNREVQQHMKNQQPKQP